MAEEADLDIMNTPFQALEPEVVKRAMKARAEVAAKQSNKREGMGEIDIQVDRKAKKELDKADRKRLRKVQSLAEWSAQEVKERIDEHQDTTCRNCGAADYSKDHAIWECACARIQEARRRAAPRIAQIGKDTIKGMVRMGIPPAHPFQTKLKKM